MKPSLHNLGAKEIFVINNPANPQRNLQFFKNWGSFSNFDYTSVLGPEGDKMTNSEVFDLIDEGFLEKFWCGEGAINKNIIACFLAHRSIWKQIKARENVEDGDYFLIMEDDAVPTPYFLNHAFSNGEFYKILELLKKEDVELFWWGRATDKISGTQYNSLLKKPDIMHGLGAHAYMITQGIASRLYDSSTTMNFAADVFLDIFSENLKRVYAPNFSFIRQKQHLLKSRFFPKDHENRIWGSWTQPDWEDYDTRHRKGNYRNVPDSFFHFIDKTKSVQLHTGHQGIEFTFSKRPQNSLL